MLLTLAQRGSEEGGMPELLRGETPTSILLLLFLIPAVLALGALLYAIALRLSAQLLRFGDADFKNASICSAITYASNAGLGFSLSASAALMTGMMAPDSSYHPEIASRLMASPLMVFLMVVASLLIAGLIASRVLRVDGGTSRLMFWDSLVLVLLANGMLVAFAWVVTMIIRFLFALT